MKDSSKEFVRELLKKMETLNYIKPGDVPNINLYMDQVTTFMDEHLRDVKRHENDKILTKTMINNYAKNDLLPSPIKKKYSREHIYILTFIYYFKNMLSISDIQKVLNPLTNKFFDKDSKPDLDTIYKEIYELEKLQFDPMTKDVISKFSIAENSFDDVEDAEDKEFLQLFTMVCLLSFDIYLKKNVLESLIDDFSAKQLAKEKEREAIEKARKLAAAKEKKEKEKQEKLEKKAKEDK